MTEEKNTNDLHKLLDNDETKIPQAGDIVKGIVVAASKTEVRLDIGGIFMGIVRGPELAQTGEDYAELKPGDEVEATVIDEENENGEIELSFRFAGEAKARLNLKDAFENKKIIKIKVVGANRGGIMANYGQVSGFLPVSQLSPENYPRVSGGDKSKILEKLKSFVGKEMEVKVMTIDENGEETRIIFSEKEVWNEKQKDVISKYKAGTIVDGTITAVTDFGVFVNFGDNLEGLIHISELAWQRIDNPADLFKVGDIIKAEVINIDGAKIFLSAKKLMKDPWGEVEKKYKAGQIVKGKILKVNPFGLFVKIDDDIHGLAHISQLALAPGQKISDVFRADEERDFTVVSIEAKEHRMGLTVAGEEQENLPGRPAGNKTIKQESKEGEENEITEEKKEKKAKKEKKEKKAGEIKKAEKEKKPAKSKNKKEE